MVARGRIHQDMSPTLLVFLSTRIGPTGAKGNRGALRCSGGRHSFDMARGSAKSS